TACRKTMNTLTLATFSKDTRPNKIPTTVVAETVDSNPVFLVADPDDPAVAGVVADATYALGELAFAGHTIPSLARAEYSRPASTRPGNAWAVTARARHPGPCSARPLYSDSRLGRPSNTDNGRARLNGSSRIALANYRHPERRARKRNNALVDPKSWSVRNNPSRKRQSQGPHISLLRL